MRGRLQVSNVRAWLHLGVDPHQLPPDKAKLEALRKGAQKRYQALARTLHPDVTGGDERKTAALKELSCAYEEIKRLKLHRAPSPQPVVRPGVVVVFSGSAFGGGVQWNTSGSTMSTGSWGSGGYYGWPFGGG